MNSEFGLNYDCFLLLMRCIKTTGCFGDFILDTQKEYYLLLLVATICERT